MLFVFHSIVRVDLYRDSETRFVPIFPRIDKSQIDKSQISGWVYIYVHRVITFKIRNFCWYFLALGIARGHIQYTVQYSISMLGRRRGGTSFVSLSLFVLLLYNTNFTNKLKLDVLKKLNTKNNSLTGHILFLAMDKITSFSTQRKGWST